MVHIDYVVDLVQEFIKMVEDTTGADVEDISMLVAMCLENSRILDDTNFLEACRGLLFVDHWARRLN
jgi:hypothetical protein